MLHPPSCGQCFPTSVVFAPSCPLALHKRVNIVIICICLPSKGCSADKLVLLYKLFLVPTKVSLCLNIHSQSAPQQHVSCSVSCCVFQMSPKSCLMLDPSAALKAIQHKTRPRFFFYILLSGSKILAVPNLALSVPQNDGIGCKQLAVCFWSLNLSEIVAISLSL